MIDVESLTARLKNFALAPVRGFARSLSANRWGLLFPAVTFGVLALELMGRPQDLAQPLAVDFKLPSEAAVPASIPVRPIDEEDPAWIFRYRETGTEFRAGIPYWIFRIMPKIFAEEFEGQGYEHFGFTEDDHSYYSSRPVPRGMSISDSNLRSSLLKVTFSLKRVSVNCSGCHRGEYLGPNGERVLQDGMPNHTADLQGFKRFFSSAFQRPQFEATRVINEINSALAEDNHPPLIPREELLYRGLVALLKSSEDRPSAWMDPPKRADNGPGRIDPFNAVKFEVLKVPDDNTVSTLDFPSVWNQRADIRKWHHSDGNTDESFARNYGSVIGVGGIPDSVYQTSVSKVGAWFDSFPPPRYPFQAPDAQSVQRGKTVFAERKCVNCHGVYDRETNAMADKDWSKWPGYMNIDYAAGTDPERWKAFLPATAQALNDYGRLNNLWKWNSFRGSKVPGGYLCGPLDGIWARAPYLHNGSVPTIAELMKPERERVPSFYRGNRQYDQQEMGWVYKDAKEGERALFRYDTTLTGNSNAGHDHPVPAAEVPDLIAYLKTL
jgi:hypothetical protein